MMDPTKSPTALKILDYTGSRERHRSALSLPLRRVEEQPFCDGNHEDIGFKADETVK